MKIGHNNQIEFDWKKENVQEFIEFAENFDNPEGTYWVSVSATLFADLLKRCENVIYDNK